MVRGRNPVTADHATQHPVGQDLEPRMIGNTGYRHQHQDEHDGPDMNRDEKYQGRQDNLHRAGIRLDETKMRPTASAAVTDGGRDA